MDLVSELGTGAYRPAAGADGDAIRSLVERYALAFDLGDRHGFEDLWVQGAVLEVFEDGPERPATGRLRAGRNLGLAFDRLAIHDRTLHHVTTHHSWVAADSAVGLTACAAHHVDVAGEGEGEDLVMHIRYVDRFARHGEGWRFAHRRVEVLFAERRRVTLASRMP
jgi:hypothetical protein